MGRVLGGFGGRMIAVYGGSFDPVHSGHTHVVDCLQQLPSIERILVLPCGNPPHKKTLHASNDQRLHMLQLAFTHQPIVSISDLELRSDHPSYTVDTLTAIRQQVGSGCALSFVMGEDSLASLHRWHAWQTIFALANVLVLPRRVDSTIPCDVDAWLSPRNVPLSELHHYKYGKWARLDTHFVDISSTEVRQKVSCGEFVSSLLPVTVAEYIRTHKLYRMS